MRTGIGLENIPGGPVFFLRFVSRFAAGLRF